jgi:sulfatase maturation enzyme AslB (radical SAM superfamily)
MRLIKDSFNLLHNLSKARVSVIEITTRIGCRISCAYCPQEKFIKKYTEKSNNLEMSFEVYKACVDKIPAFVDIVFAGMCEPFLNPQCSRMILYAHQKQHAISVDTTLVGMNILDVEVLKKIPYKIFCVHLPSNEGLEKIEIDKKYITVLEKVANSFINISFHFHGKDVHPELKPLIKGNIFPSYTCTRAGNIEIKDNPLPARKNGIIRCGRNQRWNVLLPNGDVILCSSDYQMLHKLGNLLSGDYGALFKSKEFKRVKGGLNKEEEDILCRYCDAYMYKYEGLFFRLIKRLRRK